MTIKNFATFGLFAEGKLLSTGSIQLMENEAIRLIMGGRYESLAISVYGFEGEKVIEETRVLSLRKVNEEIYIANMLLKTEVSDEETDADRD